jgi:hypothetical protein
LPRGLLAEAIRERDVAERAAAIARFAVEGAVALVEKAEGLPSAAKGELASAREGQAARLRQAAGGGAPPTAAAALVREARAAETDAADDVEAARSALAACREAAAGAEDDAARAQRRVEAAVAPVLAAEVDRLLAAVEAASAELEGKRAVLSFLASTLPPGAPQRLRISLVMPPPPPPGSAFGGDISGHPALSAWRAARDALLVDPSVALPN